MHTTGEVTFQFWEEMTASVASVRAGRGPRVSKGAEITENWGEGGDQIVLIVFWQPNSLGFTELPTGTFSALWKYGHIQNVLWQKADQLKPQWFLLIFFPFLLALLNLWLLHDMSDFYCAPLNSLGAWHFKEVNHREWQRTCCRLTSKGQIWVWFSWSKSEGKEKKLQSSSATSD